MIDYCSSKRIFTFILALLGFSVIVFFVEEYAEETESGEMKMKKAFVEAEMHKKHVAHSSSDCWLKEPFTVMQSCLACSDFELRALKANHCTPTGYFDRVNCSTTGVQALRPCMSSKPDGRRSFQVFTLTCAGLLVASYIVATKRKDTLDRQTYMRVAQNFDD